MSTIADPRDIIVAPVVSEKSYGVLDQNWYTFLVHPDANKTQIKIAIQQIFNVQVLTVNTLNRQGKRKRTKTGFGQRKDTKRAIVKLADGDRIEAFGGPVAGSGEPEGISNGLSVSTSRRRRAVVAPASPTSPRSPGPTPEKSLLRPLPKKGGRNVHGRITTRHQGGGHKRHTG